jgi:hypothetical protein
VQHSTTDANGFALAAKSKSISFIKNKDIYLQASLQIERYHWQCIATGIN